MPQLKLTYFDAAGRAEPLRIALFIAGLPFEDNRLSFEQFAALKQAGAFPLGSVPVLEVDGFTYTQTSAMLRFVARLGETKLYPGDPSEAFITDSVLDTFNDTLSNAMVASMFEPDMAKKLEMRAQFAAGPMARAFGYAESVLARSGGPFFLGASLSIADLVAAPNVLQIQGGRFDGISPEALLPYPGLVRLAEAYLADPRIVAYQQK
ncbi:MAG: glutathione S-transferase family protein [Bradymonadaceae bacterium]|nr:glutathione S-transferase family protein [Lujinxingiaceae bacterium]